MLLKKKRKRTNDMLTNLPKFESDYRYNEKYYKL